MVVRPPPFPAGASHRLAEPPPASAPRYPFAGDTTERCGPRGLAEESRAFETNGRCRRRDADAPQTRTRSESPARFATLRAHLLAHRDETSFPMAELSGHPALRRNIPARGGWRIEAHRLNSSK